MNYVLTATSLAAPSPQKPFGSYSVPTLADIAVIIVVFLMLLRNLPHKSRPWHLATMPSPAFVEKQKEKVITLADRPNNTSRPLISQIRLDVHGIVTCMLLCPGGTSRSVSH